MKQINLSLLFASIYVFSATGKVVHTQAQNIQKQQPSTQATTGQEPQWLMLARQITALENSNPEQDTGGELTQSQSDAIDSIEKLTYQLDDLSGEQEAQAYRYMLDHASTDVFRFKSASSLLGIEPSAGNVKYVLTYFEKFSYNSKMQFLITPVYDSIMLRSEIPEFREFPRRLLQQASTNGRMPDELVGQAALLLVVRTSPLEKQLMHSALARHPDAGGVWNALTQIGALSPNEVKKARQMLVLKGKHPGWRLTLEVALSPYDPTSRASVRRSVEAELKDKGNVDYANILLNPDNLQRMKLQDKAKPRVLTALRFWEIEQARPYLYRLLQVKNPLLKRLAMPILAMRTPQDVLKIASHPDSRKKIIYRSYALALVGSLYPNLKPQAAQLLSTDQERKEGLVEENFSEVIQELRNKGILNAF